MVDINASLAASAPLISHGVTPSATLLPSSGALLGSSVGVGPVSSAPNQHHPQQHHHHHPAPPPPAPVPGFCNILNVSNSTDLQAVAYNSLTQNVRCKSPPTLVDNLKNGTIG